MSRQPHILPRRIWRYPVKGSAFEQLRDLSPRQRWILEQSTRRYERNHPEDTVAVFLGELGSLDGFRIIRSPL